jgi:hypothetical protein
MEERRGAVQAQVRAALGALLVAVAAGVAAAEACEVPADFTPRGRVEAPGLVVVFRTVPPAIEIGRHFAVDALVCGDNAGPTLTRVDATMPQHRHGMNYRPTLAAKGGGRYVAEGFLFHMPGRWELSFEVESGGRRTRLATDVVIE